ncbi:hypothetical protein Peur_021831 [Populus x canadensis]
MSELLNQKSSIKGKVPSGYLNAIFGLSGDWFRDTADSKYLAFDGYFISVYYLHLTASPLTLKDEVKESGPPRWDPASLSRQLLSILSKQGLTIICTKRGGDVFTNSLSNWLQTVTARPEAILFRFAPITSLLTGIPGSGYLSHAVNLYRRCKCSYD